MIFLFYELLHIVSDLTHVALLVSVFDGPRSFAPSHHYEIEARLPWVDIGSHLPGRPNDVTPNPD
jgi:hypothetical protein